jgi:hypothetical protein
MATVQPPKEGPLIKGLLKQAKARGGGAQANNICLVAVYLALINYK